MFPSTQHKVDTVVIRGDPLCNEAGEYLREYGKHLQKLYMVSSHSLVCVVSSHSLVCVVSSHSLVCVVSSHSLVCVVSSHSLVCAVSSHSLVCVCVRALKPLLGHIRNAATIFKQDAIALSIDTQISMLCPIWHPSH